MTTCVSGAPAVDIAAVKDVAYQVTNDFFAMSWHKEASELTNMMLVHNGVNMIADGFTHDFGRVWESIANMQASTGPYSLDSALQAAVQHLQNITEPNVRKVVLLFAGPQWSTNDGKGFQYAQTLRFLGVEVMVMGYQITVSNPLARDLAHLANMYSDVFWGGSPTDAARLSAGLMSRVRGDPGFMCTSFPHISTFDSNSWSFEGIGDFYLVNTLNVGAWNHDSYTQSKMPTSKLIVQVRRGFCTTPYSGDGHDTPRTTCNHGFAISDGKNTWSYLYQPTQKGVVILRTASGTPLPPIPLTGGHWEDYVVLGDGMFIIVIFSAAGGAIMIPARADFYTRLNGLCGLYNGDPTDDFTDAFNKTYGTGMGNEQYHHMGETYRVPIADSLFSMPAQGASAQKFQQETMYPIHYNPTYNWEDGNSQADLSVCAKVPNTHSHLFPSSNGFLHWGCEWDARFNRPNDLSWHIFRYMCMWRCDGAMSVMPTSIVGFEDCDHICTPVDPYRRLELVPPKDQQVLFKPTDAEKPYTIWDTTSSRVMFRSDAHMGGLYTLQLQSADMCGQFKHNISVGIYCQNPPVVNPTLMMPVVLGRYGYTVIYLDGNPYSPVGRRMTYRWRLLEAPKGVNLDNVYYSPNPISQQVMTVPKVAGDYIFQFAATDGCGITRKNITVTVACALCQPTSVVTSHNKTLWWVNAVNRAWPTRGVDGTVTYDTFPEGVPNQLAYDWTLSVKKENMPADTEFRWVSETTTAPFRRVYELYVHAPPHHEEKIRTDTIIPPQNETVFYAEKHPLFADIWQINDKGEMYRAKRVTTVSRRVVLSVEQNITLIDIPIPVCKAELSNYNAAQTGLTVTVENGYGPWNCTNYWNVQLNSSDVCQKWNAANVDIRTTCSKPVAIIHCASLTLDYDWDKLAYKTAVIDGWDSYDIGTPITAYNWVSEDAAFCYPRSAPCTLAGTDGQQTIQPRLTTPGGKITMTLDNGCLASTDSISIVARCPGEAQVQANIIEPKEDEVVSWDWLSAKNRGFNATANFPYADKTPEADSWWEVVDHPHHGTKTWINWDHINRYFPAEWHQAEMNPAKTGAGLLTSLVNMWSYGDSNLANDQYHITYHMKSCVERTVSRRLRILCNTVSTKPSWTLWKFTFDPASNTFLKTDGIQPSDAKMTHGPDQATLRHFWEITEGANTGLLSIAPGTETTTLAGLSTSYTAKDGGAVQSTLNYYWTDGCLIDSVQQPVTIDCGPRPGFKLSYEWVNQTKGSLILHDNSGIGGDVEYYLITGPPGTNIPLKFSQQGGPGVHNLPVQLDYFGNYTFGVRATSKCFEFPESTVYVRWDCPEYYLAPIKTEYTMTYTLTSQLTLDVAMDYSKFPGLAPQLIDYRWEILAAPKDSVYWVYDYEEFEVKNFSSVVTVDYTYGQGWQQINTTNTTTRAYLHHNQRVFLDITRPTEPNLLFPACFRPDVPGDYEILLHTAPQFENLDLSLCVRDMHVRVKVVCEFPAPAVVIPTPVINIELKRYEENRIMLDARGTHGAPGQMLFYTWEQMEGPDVLINGVAASNPLGTRVHDAYNVLASAVLYGAGRYVFRVTVFDGCQRVYGYIVVNAGCEIKQPAQNVTLITPWHGQAPVSSLVFSYDYLEQNPELNRGLQCQAGTLGAFKWDVVDFSMNVPAPTPSQKEETFTSKPGFAVLMTFVGLAVVGIPLGYCFWVKRKKKSASPALTETRAASSSVGGGAPSSGYTTLASSGSHSNSSSAQMASAIGREEMGKNLLSSHEMAPVGSSQAAHAEPAQAQEVSGTPAEATSPV